MRELKQHIQRSRSQSPWIDSLLRLLMVAVLAVALGLVGTAFAEYRLLYAVASLPQTEDAAALNLDCPAASGGAATLPESALPYVVATPPVPLTLRGFRCSLPPYPD